MALEKQIVNIDFTKGLSTKRDDAATIAGELVLLQNGSFDKVGAINKRLPYALLSDTSANPVGTLPTATKLLPFKESLNVITGRQSYASNPNRPDAPNEIYYYDEQRDNYDRYGEANSVITQTNQIIGDVGDTNLYSVFDCITKNNLTYHLVRHDKLVLYGTYLVVTNSLDESLSNIYPVAGSTEQVSCARLGLIGNILYIFYNHAADINLRYKTFNTNNLINPSVSAATVLFNDLSATKNFDVCSDDTNVNLYIGYNSNVANTTNLKRWNGAAVTHSATIADNSADNLSLAYENTTGPSLLVAYANAAHQVRFENFSSTLVTYGANILISAEAVAVASLTVHGTKASFSTDGWPVMWSISAALSINYQTKIALINTSAIIDAVRIFCRSVYLASKIFYVNGEHYVVAFYYSDLQSTYFIFHLSGFGANYKHRVVGRFFSQQGRFPQANIACPPSVAVSSNVARFPAIANRFFRPISYFPRYGNGMYEVVAYFNDERNFSNSEAGNDLHIVGSLLSCFDGMSYYEHNFTHYPENITLAPNGAGGMTALGTYSYVVVFEALDQFGQTHRSAPSNPAQIVLGGGIGAVQVTIPCYRVTNRGETEVVARVFRTTNLGTNYQEVGAVNVPYSADTAVYNDSLDDATLLTRAYIYTTGGVLESVAADPSWAVTTWKERICLLTERGVQFSKRRIDGNPIEFSDAFFIPIETSGGRGIALATLDDKLIIFKKDRLYYITGDGANDTGTFGQFSNPQSIVSDVGCINSKSIVVTDKGVIFQSNKGMYMLYRNLTVVYIGANLEYFTQNNPVITSSILIQTKNEARFLTASGDCLVFNYLLEQWSTYTNHSGQDLALYNNYAVRINSNNKVVVETPGTTYGDYGNSGLVDYSLKIRTGWLSFAELQGFLRVYRFLILGKFKSHHVLSVKVAYDYNPKIIDTYLFDTQGAGKSLSVIPDDAIYGGASFSGQDIYQFRGHLSKQKCEAIQLTIEDTNLSGTKESYALTNLAFEVGVKTAVFKKPAAFTNA